MISVESRGDARKIIGFGGGYSNNSSGGGGREMEETELEEGEAYEYHDDDDENIDPDVDLSYLDEKVQVVLGHFQKDFEGGVSAENLGAKFGGYGSFLPTHQRSPPVWSQPRTPHNIQNYGTPRSPNNLSMEGEIQNSAAPSGAISSVKHSAGAPPLISRPPFLESISKRECSLLTARGTGERNVNNEPLSKPNSITDHKTLKVRLKVGSDNVAQKAAAIYSDLGFPLSSPEDSPVESAGLSSESRESPYESPTSILQIMTSSPIPDGLLLTPLPDSLLHLTEKEKLWRENRPDRVCRDNHGGSDLLVDEFSSATREGKIYGGKKPTPVENNNKLIETKNLTMKYTGNGVNAPLKKEVNTDIPEGKEPVAADSSNLLAISSSKLKMSENARSTGRNTDVSGEIKKLKVKERSMSSESVKGEPRSIASQDAIMTEKFKLRTDTEDKVLEDIREKVSTNIQPLSGKETKSKGNTGYDSFKSEFDDLKVKVEPNSGRVDPQENKVKLKVTSLDRDGGKLPYVKEETLSGGKKKSKGSKSIVNTPLVLSEESSRAVSSTTLKDRKKSSDDSSSRSKLDESKFSREVGKARETYKDIFGDEEMEQAHNSMNSSDTHFRDRHKDYNAEVTENETHQFVDKPRDRSSGKEMYKYTDKARERPIMKTVENSLTSDIYRKAPQSVAPIGNGFVSDTVPVITDPVLIEENWAMCESCGKWRLLPHGVNPKELPKKWLCNMFVFPYLPGMNRCTIEEDVTTNAVRALYLPAPESQNNLLSQSNGALTGVILPDTQSLDVKHKDHNLSTSSVGKKKHGMKEAVDSSTLNGTSSIPNNLNRAQQAALKNRSATDVSQSPLDSSLINKNGIQHVSRSSDSAGLKHRHRQKDKHKLAPDGGVADRSTKTKRKRDTDQDGSRASKKSESEGLFSTEEDWNSTNGKAVVKACPISVNLPTKSSARPMKKNGEYSSLKEDLPPAKKPTELVQVSLDVGGSEIGKVENKDVAAKKRKLKEWDESHLYPSESLPYVDPYLEPNNVSLEGTSESDLRKKKKARASKSEGKESRKSMGDARTENEDKVSKIHSSGFRDYVGNEMEEGKGYIDKVHQQKQYQGTNAVSQPISESVDPLKKDLGCVLPSLAATSSSSKVSGSRKSKANFQEAKGSPVESVSSSPFRSSDKGTSARRVLLGKDEPTNLDFSVIGSHRKSSDGEVDVGGGHSGKNEKARSGGHRVSRESSALKYHDRETNSSSGGKAKAPTEPFGVEFKNSHFVNGSADTLNQREEHCSEGDQGKRHHGSNSSRSRKSGKGSSSRSKDKQKSFKSEVDKGKIKVSDSLHNQERLYPSKTTRNELENESQDPPYHHDDSVGGKYKSNEKYGVKGDKDEKSCVGKKEYSGKWSNEGRRESQPKYGGNVGTDVKMAAACSKDGKTSADQGSMQDRVGERASHRSLSDRSDHDRLEASGRLKSQLYPHTGDKQESQARCPRPVSSTHRGNGTDLPLDASGGGVSDELKVAKHLRKPDNQGAAQNSLRHSTPGRVSVSDLDGPSPARKDSSSQAGNLALKEARNLKHTADRLKGSASGLESTGLYFEAVLKFLHGASLLEPNNVEISRPGDFQSVHIYSTTTSLCEFVAQEYERCKEMAFAALAYKCLEVACMRVVYFKHWSVNKDRNELQGALHLVPSGESPSSSASDVDNLNNQSALDKVALAKGVGSPHVAGNHVIAARNRPNFQRVLTFDVNSAMEASRKSQNAFAAASASLEESQIEGICSVKRALDFNFYDVQGLLRLVKLAMEAITPR
ncbi:hypothetical protein ACHQM5_026529 [Ranunculus cassubicifolius]